MTMDLDAYLRRIGHGGPVAVDAATLIALHRAHLLTVPFENLDIGRGEPIVLDLARHYAKIVVQRRGGFCYEQNALFAWALDAIGFRTSALAAGVWANRDGVEDFGDPTSHRLIRVDLDEPWIADVGFGENFRAPLRLVDGLLQRQALRAYRLARTNDAGHTVWTLSSCDPQGTWTPSYRFADLPRATADFARMCRFHQTSPRSPFTQKRLCSLALPDGGRLSLSGDEWIVTTPDGARRIEPVRDDQHAADLLRQSFGIVMPPREHPEDRC